jgi:predicted RNase H-like nuclease (RuvC/YqgF family)
MATLRRSKTAEPKATGERLTAATAQATIDAISLKQALLDVEAANARVIDLTRRLTTMNQEILDLRSQLSRGAAGRTGEHGLARDLFEARAEIAALRLKYNL